MNIIQEDIAIIEQNMDIISILIGGDFNSRLGNITGDKSSKSHIEYATPFLNMIDDCSLSVGCSEKNNSYTCYRHNGNSINDYFLFSSSWPADFLRNDSLKCDSNLDRSVMTVQNIVKTHPGISLNSDHCLLTTIWSIHCPPINNFWGSPSIKR